MIPFYANTKIYVVFLLVFSWSLSNACTFAQPEKKEEKIRLNQIGFYPEAPKLAIVLADQPLRFSIKNIQGKTVFSAALKESANPALNGKKTFIADFSSFKAPGKYIVQVEGFGSSYPFVIQSQVYKEVAQAALKSYYFQRASTALPQKYAGKWHRTAGHPDTVVLVHASAASAKRPEGFHISSSRGWYDAGDYNKYIVNSGITMGTMLSFFEDYPEYAKHITLNIPESKNNLPDMLDELLWNLRWMLTMQDPHDGGVYHKLTNAKFDGMVMPDFTKAPRYVVQKSTAATLDFAAVMAQAYRILKTYPKELPGLADTCLNAATFAWKWAQANPAQYYEQDKMNTQFEPAISTGAYGDNHVQDEFIWAAAELYVSTSQDSYYDAVKMIPDANMPLPNWSQVRLFAYYTLIRHEQHLSALGKKDIPELKKRFVAFADQLAKSAQRNAYQTVIGQTPRDYNWGGTANAANQGIVLLQAYRLSKNKSCLDLALSNVDYLLGRNGTGYSFVTGFGSKRIQHPHHRPSIADQVVDPVPGFLSGGPNPGAQDHIKTASSVPDEAFIDDARSYATNEIAINWNAALVYLLNAVEASSIRK